MSSITTRPVVGTAPGMSSFAYPSILLYHRLDRRCHYSDDLWLWFLPQLACLHGLDERPRERPGGRHDAVHVCIRVPALYCVLCLPAGREPPLPTYPDLNTCKRDYDSEGLGDVRVLLRALSVIPGDNEAPGENSECEEALSVGGICTVGVQVKVL